MRTAFRAALVAAGLGLLALPALPGSTAPAEAGASTGTWRYPPHHRYHHGYYGGYRHHYRPWYGHHRGWGHRNYRYPKRNGHFG
jgi:hypothetical protein